MEHRHPQHDAIAAAYADGCRSILIRTDPADTPIQFYRRLGLTDEVYWRQRYEPAAEGTESRPAMHPSGLRLIVQSPVSQTSREETR